MKRGLRKTKTRRTPIGLDVGSRFVKAIQFEPYSTGLRVVAAALVPRANAANGPASEAHAKRQKGPDKAAQETTAGDGTFNADEARKLSDILVRAGFEGNRLVVAAPPKALLQSVLELPPRSSSAPLDQLARLELGRAHRCAADVFEMGCWDLPPVAAGQSARAGKGTTVMAVGYPHAAANALLDAFESAGLLVEAIDAAPCALARACAPAISTVGPEGGMTAILDIGWSAATLILLHCDAVIYGRTLGDAGLGTLHATLTRRLNLEPDVTEYLLTEVGLSATLPDEATGEDAVGLPDDARGLLAAHVEAVVRELLASFSYAARQYPEAPIARLLLVGGGAAIPELGGHISAVLGVDAQPVLPTEVASYDASLIGLCGSPVMIAATGLAQFPEL
jgi:Tfp pilus assembly PilM family ATPase